MADKTDKKETKPETLEDKTKSELVTLVRQARHHIRMLTADGQNELTIGEKAEAERKAKAFLIETELNGEDKHFLDQRKGRNNTEEGPKEESNTAVHAAGA